MKDENVYTPKIAISSSSLPPALEEEIVARGVIIGYHSTSSHRNCVLIGHNLTSDHDGQVKIGNTEIHASGEITPEQVQTIIDAFRGLYVR